MMTAARAPAAATMTTWSYTSGIRRFPGIEAAGHFQGRVADAVPRQRPLYSRAEASLFTAAVVTHLVSVLVLACRPFRGRGLRLCCSYLSKVPVSSGRTTPAVMPSVSEMVPAV